MIFAWATGWCSRRYAGALAWSGLAFTYVASVMNGDAEPSEVRPRAQEAAKRALQAEPDLAAAAEMRRALELEPLEPINHALASQVAFQGQDYASAVEHANHALVINPQFWIGFMQLGQADEQQGKIDLALKALMNAEQFSAGNSKPVSTRGYSLAKAGRTKEARDVLRTLETRSSRQYVPPYAMALVNAELDDQQATFKWLDRAYEARDVHLIFLTVDPKWDPYRDDPRFKALLKRCGFTMNH